MHLLRFCIPLRLGSSPAIRHNLGLGRTARAAIGSTPSDLAVCASLVIASSPTLEAKSRLQYVSKNFAASCGTVGHLGASTPAQTCRESGPFLPKSVRRRAVMISPWKGSNPFSCSTFSANRLNLRGLCFFGRLAQGVEQVLVEAAAWAGSIGETANAPTRGMDLTEFA